MSSTRRAKDGTPPRQERWASSRAYRKGLLGNLVARRAAKVRTQAGRELVHFLADVSWRDPLLRHPTCNLFKSWPWPSKIEPEEAPLVRLAREVGAEKFPALPAASLRALPAYLERLCLDASLTVEDAALPGWPTLFADLRDYQASFERMAGFRVAETSTKHAVFDLLDYALGQGHGLYICEGQFRTGKSFSAQCWAQSHIGRCRYVQLTSAPDERAFLSEIARALGIACGLSYKAAQIRTRIEAVLREQQLLLIVDEASFIWPAAVRPRELPYRASFLMTSLLNFGVPVALIGSTSFSALMRNVEKKLPQWGMSQFRGRVRQWVRLPNRPSSEDLMALADTVLPLGSEPARLLLCGHAMKSEVPLTALETAASRAEHYARQDNRLVTFEDVSRVLIEAGTLSPTTAQLRPFAATPAPLSRSFRTAETHPPRASRGTIATTPRRFRG